MKKLLLIVVDACASRVMNPAMQAGKLPNISALSDAGTINFECSAIFPSITPAATSSIITGRYPKEHGIPGAYWYDMDKDEVAYYGDDFWVILNQGIDKFFKDFLFKLNHQRLRAETLFQTVERAGLRAACLNYLIFRGDVRHKFRVPLLISILGLLPRVSFPKAVYGPSILELGDFVSTSSGKTGKGRISNGGPTERFGIEDDHTAELLIRLAKDRALPGFTLAYFPDNDFRSHEVGPQAAVTVLEKLDTIIGDLVSLYGGAERMLRELCVLMTGDHSQSDVQGDEEAGIRLEQLLKGFSIANAGEPWNKDEQLKVCTNMRAAQIYFRHPTSTQVRRTIELLLDDRRVDQVIWSAGITEQGERGYRIATGDRGTLHLWQGADDTHNALDQQGCAWSWSGKLETVDGRVSGEGVITFSDYPNAFERISGGLDCENSGHLWVTARPGYELQIPCTTIHAGGGSHGSLHALDSTVPLLLAGPPPGIELPANPRTVDVAPLCLAILGIAPERPAGSSHVKQAGHE